MHIVICEPEIPQNTGNIARTCALTRTDLHLVKPLGFSLADKYMKRAGLDYWDKVKVTLWDNLAGCQKHLGHCPWYFATTKTRKLYDKIKYAENSVLVFGSESRGLDEKILAENRERLIRIPMLDIGRSLNLSNAAAIVLYEAIRQNRFPGLS
jgi:tRNA (cytidine/uridine-2'-O-)-methyltransferase